MSSSLSGEKKNSHKANPKQDKALVLMMMVPFKEWWWCCYRCISPWGVNSTEIERNGRGTTTSAVGSIFPSLQPHSMFKPILSSQMILPGLHYVNAKNQQYFCASTNVSKNKADKILVSPVIENRIAAYFYSSHFKCCLCISWLASVFSNTISILIFS